MTAPFRLRVGVTLAFIIAFGQLVSAQNLPSGIAKLWSVVTDVSNGGSETYPRFGSDGAGLVLQTNGRWVWAARDGTMTPMPVGFSPGIIGTLTSELIVSRDKINLLTHNSYQIVIYYKNGSGQVQSRLLPIIGDPANPGSAHNLMDIHDKPPDETFIANSEYVGDGVTKQYTISLYKIDFTAFSQNSRPILGISSNNPLNIQVSLSSTNSISVLTSTNLLTWSTFTNIANPSPNQSVVVPLDGKPRQFFYVEQR